MQVRKSKLYIYQNLEDLGLLGAKEKQKYEKLKQLITLTLNGRRPHNGRM